MKNAFIQPLNFYHMNQLLKPVLILLLFLNTMRLWAQDCQNDTIKPVCLPPANVTVNCQIFDPTLAAYGNALVSDNCCLDSTRQYLNQRGLTHLANYSDFDLNCNKGTILRVFKAYDCKGNISVCIQKVEVQYLQDYYVRFPNDMIITEFNGSGFYGTPEIFGKGCELIGTSYADEVFTNLPNGDIRLERTWAIINWCTYNPNQLVTVVPNPQPQVFEFNTQNLPGPVVSADGTLGIWAPTITKVHPYDQSPTNYASFYNSQANGYQYKQFIYKTNGLLTGIEGKVFADTLNNCSLDVSEPGLPNWKLKGVGLVTGYVAYCTTDNLGNYVLQMPTQDSIIELSLLPTINLYQGCGLVDTVFLHGAASVVHNVPANLNLDCRILSVELSTIRLRRCFKSAYQVVGCNLNLQEVPNARVEIQLDPYFLQPAFSLPAVDLGGNKWSVALGNLPAGTCKDFQVNFDVSCDAVLGQTHCTEAHIFPDTVCRTSLEWSGANVALRAWCAGDSVHMEIKNNGSGDMDVENDFVVVEDIIMYEQDKFQLQSGGVKAIVVPGNGATWRLQADQPPFHPYGGPEAVVVEGCGGVNQTGLVRMLPLENPNPFVAIDCEQNTGSYDPNDIQATPEGVGASHLLEPNIPIEYKIRFQNTGTDTAFNVVILDTLPASLDISTARPQVSSHAFYFEKLPGNVLKFTFENILLPDSASNQLGSNGYIKYYVAQVANNPVGTHIENRAAIYFDFNKPVITNTAFHRIGKHFIVSGIQSVPNGSAIEVFPNPGSAAWNVVIPIDQAIMRLENVQGQVLFTKALNKGLNVISAIDLSPGLYWFQISGPGLSTQSGKLVKY